MNNFSPCLKIKGKQFTVPCIMFGPVQTLSSGPPLLALWIASAVHSAPCWRSIELTGSVRHGAGV